MNIIITWHGDQFNVELAKAGEEPFLSIKGCRVVQGTNGPFVSWPATKNQSTGKYWNHVWASEGFAAAVLERAQGDQPQRQAPPPRRAPPPPRRQGGSDDFAPF